MSRQDQIRANKRNQFQQRRQVNQLYAQRLSQGMTPGQAATTPYTVTDSDTLESVASANGVDVTNVLAANPDMKNLQTGMVINVPGSEAWRAQGYGGMSPSPVGGVGLPSNAALGGTTNNPQGNNAYAQREADTFAALSANATAAQQQNKGNGFLDWVKNLGKDIPIGGTPSPYQTYKPPSNSTWSQQPAAAAIQATTPKTNTSAPPPGFFQSQYQYMSRNLYHQQIRTKVDTAGYMPTPGELNILETMGFIKKDKTSVGGGGYSRKRGRGGGGGGGGKNLGGGGGVPREPAFAGGSGFGGLVNWRI
jgi:LysM repeat protein